MASKNRFFLFVQIACWKLFSHRAKPLDWLESGLFRLHIVYFQEIRKDLL